MKQYLNLLQQAYMDGVGHETRTAQDRYSVYGGCERFDISGGKIALVTTRKIFTKALIHELLFFISGETDITSLQEAGVKLWDKWAPTKSDAAAAVETFFKDREPAFKKAMLTYFELMVGNIGPMYGYFWRKAPRKLALNPMLWTITYDEIPVDKLSRYRTEYERAKIKEEEMTFGAYAVQQYYGSVDQLNELVRNLKKRPYSARLVIESWDPELIPSEDVSPQENVFLGLGALAPCHKSIQCFVKPPKVEGGKKQLILSFYQRSVDIPVGAPYNLAEYSIFAHMLAKECDMEAVELIWQYGDAHIYADQMEKVPEQLSRTPGELPTVWLNPEVKSIFCYTPADIRIDGYEPQEVINYPVSV